MIFQIYKIDRGSNNLTIYLNLLSLLYWQVKMTNHSVDTLFMKSRGRYTCI